MGTEAFEIATTQQVGSRKWLLGGRAYVDIKLRDTLTTSSARDQSLRVVEIVTYGKTTDLLSAMMTGRLTLEGELQLDEGEPKFLYVRGE